MKKIRVITISIFLLSSMNSFSQVIIINKNDHPNSTETETEYKNADFYSDKIEKALKANDLKQANYYFGQWVEAQRPDVRYFKLKADYCIAMGNPKGAKRMLMKAYKKHACYECKEIADKLDNP